MSNSWNILGSYGAQNANAPTSTSQMQNNFDYATYQQQIYQQQIYQQQRKVTKADLLEQREQLYRMIDNINQQLLNFQADCPTIRELENDPTLKQAYDELILLWKLKGGKPRELDI